MHQRNRLRQFEKRAGMQFRSQFGAQWMIHDHGFHGFVLRLQLPQRGSLQQLWQNYANKRISLF
ncbi:hypothetical protein K788_00036570 [Paraburkholderia caribensis MBA4]|uniref:Uncharacterized protein n=1 Tax=Paraburkholderia caribensis MBA4 TaxID=1323664 RepID=A0A0N7JVI7_9BURK|nr:hypothetical protein K788_00036570 [Paraburkholderia caribensis MBA4]